MARFVSVGAGDAAEGADLMAAGGAEARDEGLRRFSASTPASSACATRASSCSGRDEADAFGGRHLSYYQFYRGVPVFAAALRTHFDAAGRLTAVNGTLIPDLDLNVTPVAGGDRRLRRRASASWAASMPDPRR